MSAVIETSFPVPEPHRPHDHPLSNIAVGESYLAEILPGEAKQNARARIISAARRRRVSIRTRTVEGGIRVWRVG